jgi:hypothetical protein
MNKIQLLVMWVGIALFLLLLIFPPHHEDFYLISNPSHIYKGAVKKELQRTFLIAIPLVAGGLIVTFRDKNKSDKAWQLLTAFWRKLTK